MAYPDSNLFNQPYSRLTSAYELARKPQVYGKLVQKYGQLFGITNFLHMAGQVIDVKGDAVTIFEEGAPERPITVSIAQAAAPIAVIVVPAAGDGSDKYIRVGFDIMIPATYTNSDIPEALRITHNGTNWIGTAYNPLLAITETIATKEFIQTASSWGYGTHQPTPMSQGYYTREASMRILKETGGVEGGMLFKENWEEIETAEGKKGVVSKLITEMDFRLDKQKDAAIFLAQKNANDALTDTSFTTQTSKIPSFDGLIPTMKLLAQELPYTTNFDMTSFEAVNALLESVGVTNRELDFLVGTGLMSNIETTMGSWLNTNSPGTELYDMINKYIGFGVKTVEKNGCRFNIIKLDSLSNPSSYGAPEYPYRDWGFMFPKGERKVNFKASGDSAIDLKLPHLTLGYANNKGENRRHVFNIEAGVNGLGYDQVANDVDGVKFYSMCQILPIFTYMNQTILVTKS